MTSASTKRRHNRKTAPPHRALPGLASEVMREMLKPPGQEDYESAFRRARSAGSKDAEIRRLRTAMVHAMDEAEAGARFPLAGLSERMRWQKVAKLLRAALETK